MYHGGVVVVVMRRMRFSESVSKRILGHCLSVVVLEANRKAHVSAVSAVVIPNGCAKAIIVRASESLQTKPTPANPGWPLAAPSVLILIQLVFGADQPTNIVAILLSVIVWLTIGVAPGMLGGEARCAQEYSCCSFCAQASISSDVVCFRW